MREATVVLTNELGLHMRAAAELVKLAEKFACTITLERADKKVAADARSITQILLLAATKGTSLRVTADGEDEEGAIRGIVKLFADRFGEK